ncbi:MAG: GMC oxidoreductase [Acidimicrobiales bacterium]
MYDGRSFTRVQLDDADVCIVGAGPAGLAVAEELDGLPLRVCLIESGGRQPDGDTDDLSDCPADVNDDLYFNTRHLRSRAIGGTAHQWCVEIDREPHFRLDLLHPADFEHRPWLDHSGWPITADELAPFYRRATVASGADPERFRVGDPPAIDAATNLLVTARFLFGAQRVFTEEIPHDLAASENVSVISRTTVVELVTNTDGTSVTGVVARTLAGNEIRIRSRIVILAQGAFEVPRLLLASRRHDPVGVGNRHDLVGRFLMDHQIVRAGEIIPEPGRDLCRDLAAYDVVGSAGQAGTAALTVDNKVLDHEHLLRSAFMIAPSGMSPTAHRLRRPFGRETTVRSPAHVSALTLRYALRDRERPRRFLRHVAEMIRGADDLWAIKARRSYPFRSRYSIDVGGWSDLPGDSVGPFELFQLCEQAPNPDNRVTLGAATDRLGMTKGHVSFRWGAREQPSVLRTQQLLDDGLAEAGVGRVSRQCRAGVPLLRQMTAHHPAGTARMATDPADGVVDPDCRVHGVDNLFVASSAVFPTAGYAAPTLTIIALAIRVADRVRDDLGHPRRA